MDLYVSNEKIIWDYLMIKIQNAFGVAGLMGNLFAESSLNPMCKSKGNKDLAGWQYTRMVDDGTIDIQEFSRDGIAYGLAQWCYWSRKESMYLAWQEAQKDNPSLSIGDIEFQLSYLVTELPKYKTVWTTLKEAKSIKEASDIVLERYEKPANMSDKVKEKRVEFGQMYYDQFALYKDPTPQKFYVLTTVEKALIRRGNGKNYGVLTRVEQKGTKLIFIARSDNNWFAVEEPSNKPRFVGWMSGDVAEVILE